MITAFAPSRDFRQPPTAPTTTAVPGTRNAFGAARLVLAALAMLCAATVGAQEKLVVHIEGVDEEQRENIRLLLSLQPEDVPKSAAHVRRQFRKAPAEIERALQALGYYQVEVESELKRTAETWEAIFRIEPGPPVRIRNLDLRLTGDAEADPAFKRLVEEFPLRPGRVLNHGTYDRAKRDWQNLAAERGYFDGQFSAHEVRVDVQAQAADIQLHYDGGRRYRFGAIEFDQHEYKESFLGRFVPFKAGDPYHSGQLLKLRTALENSDRFSEVDVRAPREEATDGSVPVRVVLRARPTYKLSSGIGFGTDTGARLSLGWDKRRVNRSGHQFTSSLAVSQIGTNLGAAYQIPLKDPLREKLEFQAGWKEEDTDTSDSTITSLGVSRTLVRRGNWLESHYLSLQSEDFTVGSERGTSTLILPGINWTRTRADDRLNPRRGDRIFFEVKGTDRLLGSDTRFVQTIFKGKLIKSLGANGRVLLRTDVGASWVDEFSDLPASQRFFAGGDQSVRGYDYKSLGPRDATGEVVGGRYLLVGSLEYEHRIRDKWSVAAFYDIGNSIDRATDPLKRGVGVGLRWRTPVGPIRVDVASALDEPSRPLRLHIYLGPDL